MQTFTFHDFDAFVANVRDVESTMLLHNPKHRCWQISHIDLPEIHVQFGRLGSGNVVEGQSSSNGYLLYLPLTKECPYFANGVALGRDSFMILEPGCEFCLSTEAEHDWCAIFVPTHKAARGGDLEEPSSDSEKMVCRVTRPNRQIASQFRTSLKQIVGADTMCPQFGSTAAAHIAAEEMLKIASCVVGKSAMGKSRRRGRPKRSRQDIIRCAREVLEKCDYERVLVADLATAAQVSERTLRAAFQEYYAMGPERYLRLRQLNRIHRALQAADRETVTVTDVLVQHGEWEFGRFSSRYLQLFGELPSQTLQTKRRS